MNAKEFRIGNHVEYHVDDFYNTNDQEIGGWIETTIDPEDLLHLSSEDDDDYRPILLTPEWLERFGFELDYESRYRKEYVLIAKDMAFTFCFSKHKKEDNWFSVKGLMPDLNLFQHVHQLQNLYFALTGEELV